MYQALFLIFVSIFISACSPTLSKNPTPPSNNPTTVPQTATNQIANSHPLSIPSLINRKYESQIIQTEPVNDRTSIITYKSDDLDIRALIIRPQGTPPDGGWPVVFVNHGYIPPTEYSVERSYINTSNYFAANGFLVLKPDYRGHDDSQGTPSKLLSRSEYAIDVLNLVSLLPQISDANPNQVFLYGHSMGGEVSLITAIVNPSIRAISLWAPATKAFPENALYFARTNGDQQRLASLESELDEIPTSDYDQFGSFTNLNLITQPINLHFGTRDESVPYEWGTNLNQELENLDKQVNFYTYPNDTHDIPNNWSRALNQDVAFFRSFIN